MVLRAGFLEKEKIVKSTPLSNLDSVETNDLGEVSISFESAFRIRVFTNALVTFEKIEDNKSSHVIAYLKRGDLKVEALGRDGELFIAKNGERIKAADFEGSTLQAAPVETPEATPTPPINTSLQEDEIYSTMNANRSSFFKCYTQLLQQDTAAKGEVTLSFTIENSGKLSVMDSTSATLGREDFKKCLLEVLSRITFRQFEGPPISTLFPLKFE